ncbi:sulfite oxidase-like oxidoreductase [Thalassobacillus sp. CUG 92003]|uniref:sulfite oxidase-like oxidoreductase n=1 Tax=Thalassobacillus sp. CUG 92003 TaxID=2736641 RepID=UPI0015E74B5E|nr:sulfite oxidase-like oxidoreductase [Thalassobacillus sp. CUG 92003]
MNKADRLKKSKTPPKDERYGDRLPPGQVLTEKFPILHVGDVPAYQLDEWDLRVFGEVEEEQVFSFPNLMNMVQSSIVCDIHCVTRWSKFDTEFTGTPFTEFLKHLSLTQNATHVKVHGDYDYTANVPLADLQREDVMLAHSYNGEPLTTKHGWPLRLVIPHLYFWKSVKWVRGFEFLQQDEPGYWEENGFHHYGDPYKEQRFSNEDMEMPMDEWKTRDYD